MKLLESNKTKSYRNWIFIKKNTLFFLLLLFGLTTCAGGGSSDTSPTASIKWVTVDSVSIYLTSAVLSGTAWISDNYVNLNCVGIGCFFDQHTNDYPGVNLSFNNLTTGSTGTVTSTYGGGTMWVHRWKATVPITLGKNTVQILAYDPSGAGGFITVDVIRQPLVSISVTPTNPSIADGLMKQFIATGTFSDNSTQNITTQVTWTSSDATKVTIDNGGVATGAAVGSATIIASSENIAGSTTLTVTPWTSFNSNTTNSLNSVALSNSYASSGTQFVAVGYNGTILTSPDGVTWTQQASGTGNDLHGVTWGGTQFVSVGYNSTILTSPDGVIWTKQGSNCWSGCDLHGVAWGGMQFVAVGSKGTILTSPDGVTWTSQASGTGNDLHGVTSFGAHVVVGGNGTILTSSDGVTWTPQASGTGNDLHGVTWSGTQFVAVGSSGTILTFNGEIWTWTSQTSGIIEDLYDVVWSWTEFVAVGTNGTILTSPNGVAWTSHNSGSYNTLRSVAKSGTLPEATQLVAVGDGGTIFTALYSLF
jgi:hypothetical protein